MGFLKRLYNKHEAKATIENMMDLIYHTSSGNDILIGENKDSEHYKEISGYYKPRYNGEELSFIMTIDIKPTPKDAFYIEVKTEYFINKDRDKVMKLNKMLADPYYFCMDRYDEYPKIVEYLKTHLNLQRITELI